jgi:hypothetical protein
MNKLVALALAMLLVVPSVLGAIYVKPEDIRFREGGVHRFNEYLYDPRVQDKTLDQFVYLTPPKPPVFARGYPHYYPRGTAKVQSLRSQYKPIGHVVLQVKDLRPSIYDNSVYQAWLYDADSGYLLNLGQFLVEEGNNARVHYSSTHYFDAYDFVLVTREPYNDPDPRPSNDEVLIGRIAQKKLYEPEPLLGERASYGYSYYNI